MGFKYDSQRLLGVNTRFKRPLSTRDEDDKASTTRTDLAELGSI
jgi:hypothetical protein